MRRLGILFTALALLAVQAPWVVCACDAGGLTPHLLGLVADQLACECMHAHDHATCAHGHHEHGHHGHGHHDRAGHHHAHGRCAGHAHGHEPRCPQHHVDVHADPRGTPCRDGAPNHDHDGDDHGPEGHVAFRLPLGTLPAALTLDAADTLVTPLALLASTCPAEAPYTVARTLDERPPGDPVAPSVRTERLLL